MGCMGCCPPIVSNVENSAKFRIIDDVVREALINIIALNPKTGIIKAQTRLMMGRSTMINPQVEAKKTETMIARQVIFLLFISSIPSWLLSMGKSEHPHTSQTTVAGFSSTSTPACKH